MSNITSTNTRKHLRDDDDSDHFATNGVSGKKICLDHLFRKLSIDNNNDNESHRSSSVFEIDSKVDIKFPSDKFKNEGPGLNSYLADKMYSHFHDIYISKLSVLKWSNPYWMIMQRFQRWVLRLFNRFYKKYHLKLGTKVKPFKKFSQLMEVVNSPTSKFGWSDLVAVLQEENYLESISLINKNTKKIKSTKITNLDNDDDNNLGDVSYNYWDRLKNIGDDLEMFDDPNTDISVYSDDEKHIDQNGINLQSDTGTDMELE